MIVTDFVVEKAYINGKIENIPQETFFLLADAKKWSAEKYPNEEVVISVYDRKTDVLLAEYFVKDGKQCATRIY